MFSKYKWRLYRNAEDGLYAVGRYMLFSIAGRLPVFAIPVGPEFSGRTRSEVLLKFQIAHPDEKICEFDRTAFDSRRDFEDTAPEITE